MSKHTPGPWHTNATHTRVESAMFKNVANVTIRDFGEDERRANARLILAAPDLLAVVTGFRRKLETYTLVYPGDKELQKLLAACDAAIALAEGA